MKTNKFKTHKHLLIVVIYKTHKHLLIVVIHKTHKHLLIVVILTMILTRTC